MNDVTLAILLAFAMIYAPRVLAAWAQLTMPGGFNWAYSRDQQAQMKGFPKRAQAAHLNGVEGFAPFAVAALMAQQTAPNAAIVGQLALGYAATRVLFVLCYLLNLNPWRTIVFLIGLGFNIALFVVAAGA